MNIKFPTIDTSDYKWAEADWPKIEWLDNLKVNMRRRLKTFIISTAKRIATSKKLREKIIDFGKFQKIDDDTYRISTDFVFQSYLFVGKKKALLVDTGLGIGNLYDEVLKVTDKPLTVVCTHSHFGVVGGAGQFDEVKIAKADLKYARWFNEATKWLVAFTKKAGKNVDKKANFVELTKQELENGFDLGGRTIKIERTPSHTKGSCCFIDEHKNIAVVGDVITPLGIELLPVSLPLNEYSDTLEKLMPKLDGKKIYCSYFPKALDRDFASDFKTALYQAYILGNDSKKPIRVKKGYVKKLIVVYYGVKANRRDKDKKWAAIKSEIR